MKIRLAFVAIAVSVLSVTACRVDNETLRAPSNVEALKECVTEDAKGPCVWHADQSGNGSGLSFDVDESGNIRYWLSRSEIVETLGGPSDYREYESTSVGR